MGFDFVLSGRFIVGLVVGVILYHFWLAKQSKKAS